MTCPFMGPLIPCFGFLVMSPLGFKVTSGVTPTDLFMASMAASCFSPLACFSRGRMPDLIGRPHV